MKRPWIKWSLLGIAVLAAAVGVPIIINECYKANRGYITEWGAADVLSFYGTILSAFVTIVTIVATIGFTKKQIQRDSYLKSETEKWSKIETIFATALDAINPIRPMTETIDIGIINPNSAILTFQKYQMRCRTAMDQLNAFLNIADYPKVKALIDGINKAVEEFIQVCEEEISAYGKLRDFSGKGNAENVLRTEAARPNSFSKENVAFSKTLLEKMDGISHDDIMKAISASNDKMVSAYETTYRSLLQLKGQTFDVINAETRQKADSILSFGGKPNAHT